MEFKGTSGDWSIKEVKYDDGAVSYDIISNETYGWGDWIASALPNTTTKCTKETTKANAQIMAHAPQLLQTLIDLVEQGQLSSQSANDSVVDLINQATTINK